VGAMPDNQCLLSAKADITALAIPAVAAQIQCLPCSLR